MRMSKVMIFILMCAILLTSSACSFNRDQTMYLLYHSRSQRIAMDITIEKQVWELEKRQLIPINIGIGRVYNANFADETKAVLSVSSKGCTINGAQDTWSKEYRDFLAHEKFSVDEKQKIWFMYPDLIPRYHETVEITFPEGECSEMISIILTTSYRSRQSGDIVTKTNDFSIYYMKTDSKVVFYSDSERDYSRSQAQKLLE